MINHSAAPIDNKRAWTRPTVQRIAAGSAESGQTGRTDAGGGFQAS